MANINTVCISGNLTRDPETRQLSGDNSVTKLRVANNIRKKVDGTWTDVANYFDVTVWGKHGETVQQYLSKGDGIIVLGRLEWREWQAEDGTNRQGVEIVAQDTQFLAKAGERSSGSATESQTQLPTGDDDDIPF